MSTPKPAVGEQGPPATSGQADSAAPLGVDRDWNSVASSQRALLNILEDFAAEKNSLQRGQRAMLNILDDFNAEKARMEGSQRAVLNILEDSVHERTQLEAAQRSMVNILDDFSSEKTQLESAQGAMLNILEDFSEEKGRLEETQRAVLNILDDFEVEKNKVEVVNDQLGKEIEERKRVETQIQGANTELLAANKELEAFSYSVSHDLRAPLRSIDGFSQALLEDYADKLDSHGVDQLQRVRRAAQRMAALIDGMLNLSRVTRSPIRLEAVSLSAMARSIGEELCQAEPARKVDFLIEDGLNATGDAHLLRAALENLIRNSWKYTSSHLSARIEFGRIQRNGKSPYFVRDDGAGFDPRFADRLFGAFQRLHTESEFPGTGIGLATVQRIIHRHGGEVWAEGEVEKGATFYFTF